MATYGANGMAKAALNAARRATSGVNDGHNIASSDKQAGNSSLPFGVGMGGGGQTLPVSGAGAGVGRGRWKDGHVQAGIFGFARRTPFFGCARWHATRATALCHRALAAWAAALIDGFGLLISKKVPGIAAAADSDLW